MYIRTYLSQNTVYIHIYVHTSCCHSHSCRINPLCDCWPRQPAWRLRGTSTGLCAAAHATAALPQHPRLSAETYCVTVGFKWPQTTTLATPAFTGCSLRCRISPASWNSTHQVMSGHIAFIHTTNNRTALYRHRNRHPLWVFLSCI